MPFCSVCEYVIFSGWLSVWSVVAPARASVGSDLVRVLLKFAVASGSNAANPRRIAFFAVSTDRREIAMSVLFAITSSR